MCNNYKTFGKSVDTSHCIEARQLYDCVLADIRKHAADALADNNELCRKLAGQIGTDKAKQEKTLEKELRPLPHDPGGILRSPGLSGTEQNMGSFPAAFRCANPPGLSLHPASGDGYYSWGGEKGMTTRGSLKPLSLPYYIQARTCQEIPTFLFSGWSASAF